ncbi:uncharacterized protein LOC112491470 isoform X2 [Ziziphus jujuba]|uniref:Uncharacterized protein LOC112491470 isoform X2 n=1 Tax=Ziziphus jujuba TaxID=326968 RepID=A0ABM3ZUR7_ZIZJJ|nr:uncharacterized protein LOC112491470 isoform X2 [Ziziphus jujuba]
MGGGQVCPIDHFIPNEGDKSDPSGDWVTFVPPSSLQSISGRPLRSIVDLASPSPSKHLAGLDLIFRRKKLDFGGKLPFEAFLAGEFIFCCILPLFHRSAIITWSIQRLDSKKNCLRLKKRWGRMKSMQTQPLALMGLPILQAVYMLRNMIHPAAMKLRVLRVQPLGTAE